MNSSPEARDIQDPPSWLADALALGTEFGLFLSGRGEAPTEPEAFALGCRLAAESALAVNTLRSAWRQTGFLPFPFTEYLHGLARTAGVPLAPVFSYLGVGDLKTVTVASATACARLARLLGMGLRETLTQMRIGFLAGYDPAPVPMLLMHRRAGGGARDPLVDCEDLLREAESGMPVEVLKELRHIESVVHAEFEKADSDLDQSDEENRR